MTGSASGREVAEAFLAAGQLGDLDAMIGLLHEDMVMSWPQSGERFTGRENAAGAMRAQEVRPEVVGEARIVGADGVWVVMVPLRYGDQLFHYVAVLEIEAGRIRRGTGYFGAPFPAQASRAVYADPPDAPFAQPSA
jgi:ketosteroid isomerase-like protein